MILSNELKQIFALAFQANAVEAEYYTTKILLSLSSEFVITGQAGSGEYEEDQPDQIRTNFERVDLENWLSLLRCINQLNQKK